MTSLRWLIAGAMVCVLMPGDASATSACGPREQVVAQLKGKYHEEARLAGIMDELALMEAYASPKGTWTIVVTNSMGMTCVIAAGEAWDELPPLKKGSGI